ncbi:MAG: hypothetical protein WC334_05365, partial [Kiritimatiellales bacterium]
SDGLSNLAEYQHGSKADMADTDGDGLNDGDEIAAGTGLRIPDSDGDGLSDGAEVHTHGTNPLNADSDGDGMPDGWEVANSLSPANANAAADLDGDGLNNLSEYQHGCRANDSDSDNDGISDGDEVACGLNPASGDSDHDGLGDATDSTPGLFEIAIPKVQTNALPTFNNLSRIRYSPVSDPIYEPDPGMFGPGARGDGLGLSTLTNVLFDPHLTNCLYVTNVTVWGTVDGVVLFNGYYPYTPYGDTNSGGLGSTTFYGDVTVVTNTPAGRTNGVFEIELYDWGNVYGNTFTASMGGTCVVSYVSREEIDLIPDYDRNGTIDTNDFNRLRNGGTFRFWVNDDDDSGYDGGGDMPGKGNLNWNDGSVNGVRDLIDFFPVQIAISNALNNASNADGYRWYLCQDEGALNAVQTALTTNTAGNYLRNVSAASVLAGVSVHQITPSGWQLPDAFLNDIRDNGKGIVLIEAREKTTKPLRLELRRLKPDNSEELIGKRELPLSISSVNDMFRHKNLRPSPSVADRNSAKNELTSSGKNFVFVHGYNVSEEAAQGWHAEMFKRLYWSGSNARFYGVTWQGDQSQVRVPILGNKVTPDYHVNVILALNTAPELESYLDNLSGNTVIAAHSLGNVLTGSAVTRQPSIVNKWFMIDAAVAIEAFDSRADVQSTDMIHPDWLEYNDRLWASEWHQKFTTSDFRQFLTWRGMFEDLNVISKTYNFYSSGEEVLETHEGYPLPIDYLWGSWAWCLQEKRKGCNWATSIGGSTYGGWGFSGMYPAPLRPIYKDAGHSQLTDEALKQHPFFSQGLGYGQNLCDSHNGSNFAAANRYELLAGFIPSRTLPCGANNVEEFHPQGQSDRNFNMNAASFLVNGWPRGDGRWKHSDIREISYLYEYMVFDKFVTEGGLE